VHLHHLGHPVLGDKIYAPRLAKDFPRQMLHAWKLGFLHPRIGEWMNFEAPLPDDFRQAITEVSAKGKGQSAHAGVTACERSW